MESEGSNTYADDELAALARRGDRSAFERLIARHDRPLAAWVMRQVRQTADAEDVLQEVLMRSWKSAATYQGGNYRAWLFQIARSCLADWGRKRKRYHPRDLQEAPEPAARSERLQPTDHSIAVEKCLGKLDERGRALVRSRFGGEEDLSAVCVRLNIEKKTAQNLLSKLLNKLRECVERRSRE